MEIKIKDIKVHTRTRPRGRQNHRGRWEYPKAYEFREYEGKVIVYFSVEGETVWDNIANRRRRPHEEYRKHMPTVLEALGLPADTKYRWNIHAGCTMCPCSPGIVIQTKGIRTPKKPKKGTVYAGLEGEEYFDCWVTITGEEHPADYDPAQIAEQVMSGAAVTL